MKVEGLKFRHFSVTVDYSGMDEDVEELEEHEEVVVGVLLVVLVEV
jgi:hypothetical protein